MRTSRCIGAMTGILASLAFAGAANASATIDLFWNGDPMNTSTSAAAATALVLSVRLTAGAAGSQGAGVTIDYRAGFESNNGAVASFVTNPNMGDTGALLPLVLGMTTDTGVDVRNVNAAAFPPFVGPGLAAGQAWILGTITFDKTKALPGINSIVVTITGTDDILNITGSVITSTSTRNTATIVPEPGVLLSSLASGLVVGGIYLAARRSRGGDA